MTSSIQVSELQSLLDRLNSTDVVAAQTERGGWKLYENEAALYELRQMAPDLARAYLAMKAAEPLPQGDECERLIKAAKLLQANCIGCAQNHHGHDFSEFGMPGWLADTQKAIDEAAALVRSKPIDRDALIAAMQPIKAEHDTRVCQGTSDGKLLERLADAVLAIGSQSIEGERG